MARAKAINWRLVKCVLSYGSLAVFGVLAALALLEAGIRMVPLVEYNNPDILKSRGLQYDPSIFSRNVFAQHVVDTKWGGSSWHINEKGYRGPDFNAKKPVGIVRIIVYGGSSVFDIGASEDQDWPHLIQSNLVEKGIDNVEVINAGIPGHASFDSVGRLFSEGHIFDPDYVVLYNSWNDIKYFRNDSSLLRIFSPYNVRSDPRLNYHNELDRLLTESSHLYSLLRRVYYKVRIRATLEGAPPSDRQSGNLTGYIQELGLEQFRLNVDTFVDVARNIGAEPILVTQGRLPAMDNTEIQMARIAYDAVGLDHETLIAAFGITDEIILNVAKSKDVFVIDAASQISGIDRFFEDHVHLSQEGSKRLAWIISEELAKKELQ